MRNIEKVHGFGSSDSSDIEESNLPEPIYCFYCNASPKTREWTRVTFYKHTNDEFDLRLWAKDGFGEMMEPDGGLFYNGERFPEYFLKPESQTTVTWFIQHTSGDDWTTTIRIWPMKIRESEAFSIKEDTGKRPFVFVEFRKRLPNFHTMTGTLQKGEPPLCGFGAEIGGQFYDFEPHAFVESPRVFDFSFGLDVDTVVFSYTLDKGKLVSCSGNALKCMIYAVVVVQSASSGPDIPIYVRSMY